MFVSGKPSYVGKSDWVELHNPGITGLGLHSRASPAFWMATMHSIQWVTGTLMMVLSLGMTRMLTSMVALFRSRDHSTLDWVPMAWAACLFYSLLEFSYALTGLGSRAIDWTFQNFLMLFAVVIILFLASALILPASLEKGESMRTSFARDGRWALAFLALYEFLTIALNYRFWGSPLQSFPTYFNLSLALIALGSLFAKGRKMECVLAITFATLETSSILLLA